MVPYFSQELYLLNEPIYLQILLIFVLVQDNFSQNLLYIYNYFTFFFLPVPEVIVRCAKFIEEFGLTDGIYRISGITSNIKRLRYEFFLKPQIKITNIFLTNARVRFVSAIQDPVRFRAVPASHGVGGLDHAGHPLRLCSGQTFLPGVGASAGQRRGICPAQRGGQRQRTQLRFPLGSGSFSKGALQAQKARLLVRNNPVLKVGFLEHLRRRSLKFVFKTVL